jgi:hypothetical protein
MFFISNALKLSAPHPGIIEVKVLLVNSLLVVLSQLESSSEPHMGNWGSTGIYRKTTGQRQTPDQGKVCCKYTLGQACWTVYMIIAVHCVTAHYNLETHNVIVKMSGSPKVLKVGVVFLSRYEMYASCNVGVIFLKIWK